MKIIRRNQKLRCKKHNKNHLSQITDSKDSYIVNNTTQKLNKSIAFFDKVCYY